MKLSTDVHAALARLNTALLKGDQAELEACFQGLNVVELLSQDTLQHVRARNKLALVLLLTSLAVSNEVSADRAQFWLDCYQSMAKKALNPSIAQLGPRNVLRCVLEAHINGQSMGRPALRGCKGTNQHWQDAFELLIDTRAWGSAISLAENLAHKKIETVRWLQIAKALADRFELYVDNIGKAHTDIDYVALARLFSLCANAARNAKALDAARTLSYLRARCLEVAGDYQAAVQQIRSDIQSKNFVSRQIDIARCLCKSGDIAGAISELDQAIEHITHSATALSSDSGSEMGLEAPKRDESKFNVGAASLALSHLTSICNSRQLKTFLVSGTLLGYAREGQLLAHDKDIDVGIIGWEKQYDICIALQESGLFTVDPSFLAGKTSHYIPLRHNPTGMWIDLFVYHQVDDKLVTGVDFFFGYRQTFAFTPFDLTPTRFLGVDMFVPTDTDLNLQENFGNWRVPDASYLSHLESPSTMDKGGLPHMLTARLHALGYASQKKTIKVRKVIEVLRAHAQSPWAMQASLLNQLTALCDRLEQDKSPAQSAHIEGEMLYA
jgi:tetratricopeptide (TPR) repeat protein